MIPSSTAGMSVGADPCKSAVTFIVGEGLAPPETFPIISFYHAEHINLSVGYGACDVPKPFDQRPAAGAPRRSPTISLQRLLSVGEGLAPPETYVEMTFKSEADLSFRRVRRLRRTARQERCVPIYGFRSMKCPSFSVRRTRVFKCRTLQKDGCASR